MVVLQRANEAGVDVHRILVLGKVASTYVDVQHIMVPNQGPPASEITTGPPQQLVTRRTTLTAGVRSVASDRTLLTPEDAIYQGSPPRMQSAAVDKLQKELRMTNGGIEDASRSRRARHKDSNRSRSGRRKGTWKKLLWVKQSCKHKNNIEINC
jgi:phosphatidylinositol glycan class C protein